MYLSHRFFNFFAERTTTIVSSCSLHSLKVSVFGQFIGFTTFSTRCFSKWFAVIGCLIRQSDIMQILASSHTQTWDILVFGACKCPWIMDYEITTMLPTSPPRPPLNKNEFLLQVRWKSLYVWKVSKSTWRSHVWISSAFAQGMNNFHLSI